MQSDRIHEADRPTALAGVLAIVMASNQGDDPEELRMLEDLDAYQRIGITEDRFRELADRFRQEICPDLADHSFLYPSDLQAIDQRVDAVQDPHDRLLLCRLAGCLITADGSIRPIERMVYDRMLMRWGYTREQVSRAILTEHLG